MVERTHVTSTEDPRVQVFLGLRDQRRRQILERPGGPLADTFMAEGDVVIERGLQHGNELRSVLIDGKRSKPLPELPASVPVLAASDEVLTEITGRPELRDPLACFVRPALASPSTLLEASTRIAVLVGLNNPNNLGVVMRNAAGLGIDAVLLDPTCGDPLYRRAIRASMGQVFAVPHARMSEMPGALDVLHESGFATIALTPRGEVDIGDVEMPQRAAILLGAEGPGLPDHTLSAVTYRARIAMSNDVDSLNVANAAAIAFHQLRPART